MTDIRGQVDAGFEAVREAFESNFATHGELGAACAVYVDGHKVVDLWGGAADGDTGREWSEDTICLVFSSTKGATAICANLLAQRGELDVDAPVSSYWPEFSAEGKDDVLVRHVLAHQSGLPVIDAELSIDDVLAWDPVVEALAAQKPMWEAGKSHGYHATTYGWLVGEIVRRVTGRTVGAFFASEVAEPLGLHFHIGLAEEHHHRVAKLRGMGHGSGSGDPVAGMSEETRALIDQFIGPDTLTGRALGAPSGVLNEGAGYNRPEVWRAEVPAANGITDARSLARMYAGCVGEVDGVRILSEEQVARATERQTRGNDQVLYFKSRFGLGFMLSSVFAPYGGEHAFGHSGFGGSVGFADPEHRIGFGYVMNKLEMNFTGDPRTRGLIAAVYGSMGLKPAFV